MVPFPNFQIENCINENTAIINLQMQTPFVTTGNLNYTFKFFEKFLPKILTSTCFNYLNLPFYIEIRNTELGHLFEHILLEKLCEVKLLTGENSATFRGTTTWNWKNEPFGLFHIKINIKNNDINFFDQAFLESCNIFNGLLNYNQNDIVYTDDFKNLIIDNNLNKYPVNT
jgi:hypothetical protein